MIKRKLIYSFFILTILVLIGYIVLSKNHNSPLFTEGIDYDYLLSNYQKTSFNDEITNSRRNILTKTVEKVSPAVVGITVTEIRQYRDPFSSFFNDPFFKQFFGDRSYNQKVQSLGSGFIISPDGYILTNDHVAGNATKIVVTMTNGKHYEAEVIGSDYVSDICLLKIDAKNLPYISLGNSEDIIIAEWVIALGNPFGLFELNEQPTVTVGVISAKGMNLDPVNNRYYINMLQTDAAINGGNSGGPLINSLGEAIGMNTLIFTAGSTGNIGLGFAIPINKVKNIVTELKEKGKIERDFVTGLRIQSLDESIANYYNLETTKGIIVTHVIPNSPAAKAGLEPADIIFEIENYKINNEKTFVGILHEFRTGQTVTLKILRNNKELIKKLTLEKNK